MSLAAAILGALTALPAFIQLISEIMTFLNSVSGNDPKGYAVKLGAAMKQLNEAESDQDRQKAAKSIADAIAGL